MLLRLAGLAVCLVLLAGCSEPAGSELVQLPNGHYRIAIRPDNTFAPEHARVPVGAVVEWQNNGGTHDVTEASDPPAWSSDALGNGTKLAFGEIFYHTFDEAGTVHYRCMVHGEMGMKGTITVG